MAISLPGIETKTSINMFQTFPKFRKPEDSTDRQFPCLRNDMETSTQVSQLSYMWDPKGIMTLIDSVCGNDWETTIVVSKNMGPSRKPLISRSPLVSRAFPFLGNLTFRPVSITLTYAYLRVEVYQYES